MDFEPCNFGAVKLRELVLQTAPTRILVHELMWNNSPGNRNVRKITMNSGAGTMHVQELKITVYYDVWFLQSCIS